MFKQIIQAEMKKRGINRNALAKMSGVPRTCVYEWFSGRHDLPCAKLEGILEALLPELVGDLAKKYSIVKLVPQPSSYTVFFKK